MFKESIYHGALQFMVNELDKLHFYVHVQLYMLKELLTDCTLCVEYGAITSSKGKTRQIAGYPLPYKLHITIKCIIIQYVNQ